MSLTIGHFGDFGHLHNSIYTLGNAETERVIRTIKEELLWLEEFDTLLEAEQNIREWIERDYNQLYPHSSLGYRSPEEFLTHLKVQAAA